MSVDRPFSSSVPSERHLTPAQVAGDLRVEPPQEPATGVGVELGRERGPATGEALSDGRELPMAVGRRERRPLDGQHGTTRRRRRRALRRAPRRRRETAVATQQLCRAGARQRDPHRRGDRERLALAPRRSCCRERRPRPMHPAVREDAPGPQEHRAPQPDPAPPATASRGPPSGRGDRIDPEVAGRPDADDLPEPQRLQQVAERVRPGTGRPRARRRTAPAGPPAAARRRSPARRRRRAGLVVRRRAR